MLRQDKTLAQIAAEHSIRPNQIHPNQLSRWKATALQGLPTIFERGESAQAVEKAAHDTQTKKLYEQIGRLTTQLTWLKKSGRDPDEG